MAFALWRRHRRRISALCLADTRADADSPEARERRLRLAELVRARGLEALLRPPAPWLREGSPRWPDALRIARRQPAEAVAQASIAMAGRPDSAGDLARIDVPTAVVVGEADEITPLAAATSMHAGIPGASLSIIPEAGHLANLDAPQAFNAALRAWLRRPSA